MRSKHIRGEGFFIHGLDQKTILKLLELGVIEVAIEGSVKGNVVVLDPLV